MTEPTPDYANFVHATIKGRPLCNIRGEWEGHRWIELEEWVLRREVEDAELRCLGCRQVIEGSDNVWRRCMVCKSWRPGGIIKEILCELPSPVPYHVIATIQKALPFCLDDLQCFNRAHQWEGEDL